ncbi:hypothetical protein ACFQV2_40325 [Actinokineospora soli]|uniref:Uncharacterized protein n=1 Tax=Actinokineospora soli TaxID=1048753 RepID=A0ABW2TZH9_9PSEU
MAATLGALTFAEYATGSRTRRTEIVATRRIPPEDYVGAQYYAPSSRRSRSPWRRWTRPRC